jgi:hypothetical protein
MPVAWLLLSFVIIIPLAHPFNRNSFAKPSSKTFLATVLSYKPDGRARPFEDFTVGVVGHCRHHC